MNILKKFAGDTIHAIDSGAGTDVVSSEINNYGYSKLLIYYYLTPDGTPAAWNRAGTIIVTGSMFQSGTKIATDATVENGTKGVLATDTGGLWYVVENVLPFTVITWDNSTEGTKGTIDVYVQPFNQ